MIWIPGNVPSLKNSKVKTKNGIFSSPTVQKYIRRLGIQSFDSRRKLVKGYVDKNRPNQFEEIRLHFEKMKVGKENPLFIGYHHVRDSKRKFDFSNSVEIIQDLLTAHDFIEDDNISFIFPIPMSIEGDLPTTTNLRTTNWYSIDPECPGVFIKIF
jgi:hypothetical protein